MFGFSLQNELIFYVNGEPQGIAATNIPSRVFAVVDLYGKCAQVSIVDSSRERESEHSVTVLKNLLVVYAPFLFTRCLLLAGDFDIDVSSDLSFVASVTNLVANISSDRSIGSGEEIDADSESNTSRNSVGLNLERSQVSRCSSYQPQLSLDRLRFHTRCGSLVKLSCNGRTAERTRPLDEFNDGVVMTNRTLRPDELFEVIRVFVNIMWSTGSTSC